MAAPTDVRCEATSTSTTVIRWTYAGTAQIAVYRSTDGVSYAEITAAGTRVEVGTTSYTDTGLATATKYWYKLTDDLGSTFSNVVFTYTHACLDSPDGSDSFSLPRIATGGADPAEEFNDLAKRVEEVLGARVLEPQQCVQCPSDGALVLNCASGCHDWVVVADEDINSISMQWCDNGEAQIEFIIPPNTTRRICGFPAAFGFSGDECTQAPIVSGSTGRSVSVGTGRASNNQANPSASGSKPGYGGGSGTGGGEGGESGCHFSCTGVALSIATCEGSNSLSCGSTKSLELLACRGRPPYTWSSTGGVSLSRTSGGSTTVTPPTNSGSAVAGVAYRVACNICNGPNCSGGVCSSVAWTTLHIGCDDVFNAGNCATPLTEACSTPAASALNKCCNNNTQVCTDPGLACTDYRTTCQGVVTVCDVRTAPMISAGCNPCGLQAGSTVTVTDSIGTQATIILGA